MPQATQRQQLDFPSERGEFRAEQLEFPWAAGGAAVRELRERGRRLAAASRAANTARAYESDWRIFAAWCCSFGRESLPASGETLELWVAQHAGKWRASTVARRLTAIGAEHRRRGLVDASKCDSVRQVLAGLRRSDRRRPGVKAAVSIEELRRMVGAARKLDPPRAERDAAILLLGFAGGFRRSELAGLDLVDVRVRREGVEVELRRSKTDQESFGRVVSIARGSHVETCPVRALDGWMVERGPWLGPLFVRMDRFGRISGNRMSGQAIAAVVKRAAAGAGLDPDRYAGHSLRSGLVTAAHEAGRSDTAIMLTTGHRSVNTLVRYVRGNGFAVAAARGLL